MGTVTDTLVTDSFGNETGRTGTTDNPYGFQGEEQDATGLYYLRARYMDPATGTFTTMDTYGGSLTDPMSLHKYLFANSNPVMYSDPSGHSASLIETGAVIGIMSILSGSANAIIAEFIYKNNTDISERSTKDLDKCALTAFLTGFTTCLFSCLATFLVCVFAFTVLECLMAAAICSLVAWVLGDIADYNYRNGNEVAGIGLDIAQQAFISAEIGFVIGGLNGGGQRYNSDLSSSSIKLDKETSSKSPVTGKEWYEYFCEEYGNESVIRNPGKVEDFFGDPTKVYGCSEYDLESLLGDGWTKGAYGSNDDGWKFINDMHNDISIFYHPAGGKHNGAYYGISYGKNGRVKIVNINTYVPLPNDPATIFY